jgi:hypothetical protein
MSEKLFHAGKTILMQRLARESDKFGPKTTSFLHLHTISSQKRESKLVQEREWGTWEPIETVRALIALMGYATWESSAHLVQEAFALQALLAQVLREIGIHEDDLPGILVDQPTPQAAWYAWVQQESVRRAKLSKNHSSPSTGPRLSCFVVFQNATRWAP